jgi:Zn-dependent protease with chaperone function
MNDVWTTLAWSSVQVTLVALAALLLVSIATRRGPRAAAWVGAVSLGAIGLVTPVALFTGSGGWVRRAHNSLMRSSPVGAHRPGRGVASDPRQDPRQTGIASEWIERDSGSIRLGNELRPFLTDRLLAVWAWGEFSVPERHSAWLRVWGVLLSAGACVGLCRLGLGLWGARDVRRRSVPVNDANLVVLVEALRGAAGCRRAISIREWTDHRAWNAVVVGWRRPLVVLPGDWRQWPDDDIRAVLAHEVAHIASGDYAAGIVAQIALSFHLYHPILHWIMARLLLHQEIAADAEAARLSGGSRTYLLALSRLALRLEEGSSALPVKTFLPARRQLVRRIQMLKAKVPLNVGSLPLAGRAATVATLLVITLSVSSLRGGAPSLADEKPATAVAQDKVAGPSASTPNPPPAASLPIDLTYLAGRDMGFLAARPSAIFRIPGMKRYAQMINAEVAGLLKSPGIADVRFDVASIEQAVIGMNIQPRDRKNGMPGRTITGAFVLRSVRDCDWLPLVNAIVKANDPRCSDLTPVNFEGQSYYTSKSPAIGASGSFYLPDGRTLVYCGEDQIRALIKDKNRNRQSHWAAFAATEDWNEASRGLYAIVLKNEDHRCKFDLSPENPDETKFEQMLATSSRVVVGLDFVEMFGLKVTATYDTESGAAYAAGVLAEFLNKAGSELSELENSARTAKRHDAEQFYRVSRALLKECLVHQSGRSVVVQGRKKLEPTELAALGMGLLGG